MGKHEQQRYDYRLRLGAPVGLSVPGKAAHVQFTGTAAFGMGPAMPQPSIDLGQGRIEREERLSIALGRRRETDTTDWDKGGVCLSAQALVDI